MSDSALTQVIVLERIFDAPPEVVWKMWTEPEHFKNWYGPEGFSVPVAEMDVRVGGKRLVCMQTPDGSMKIWFTGEYTQVIPNEHLEYTDSFAGEGEYVTPPSTDGMSSDEIPVTTRVIVQLQALGERTKMVMTHTDVLTDENDGASDGWTQSFGKLERYISTLD